MKLISGSLFVIATLLLFGLIQTVDTIFTAVNAPIAPIQNVRVSQAGASVSYYRHVEEATWARWHVAIWPANDDIAPPVCEGDGTSLYTTEETDTKHMTLDFFVNDEGCWERLDAGRYIGTVSYAPRAGLRASDYSFEIVKQ